MRDKILFVSFFHSERKGGSNILIEARVTLKALSSPTFVSHSILEKYHLPIFSRHLYVNLASFFHCPIRSFKVSPSLFSL